MRSRRAHIRRWIIARPTSEEGATMVEYGMMVGLIALAAVTAVTLFGGKVAALFQSAVDAWP